MGTIRWNTRGIHSTYALVLFLVAFLSPEMASAQCLTPPGDLTSNGNTNIVDIQCSILATLASLAGSDAPGCLSPLGLTDADLNCDGEITVVDIILNIELAFDNFLTDDTNGNGWIDSCSCDLGSGTSDLCVDWTNLDMESLCAAEQGIIDSSAGAGVADSVVVCDGEDWWLPEEIEWAKNGSVVSGYGYPCTEEEGCSFNEGYRQTRTRGVSNAMEWDGVEVFRDENGNCASGFSPIDFPIDGKLIPIDGELIPIDGELIDDYCWLTSFIKALYNHTEKACYTRCADVKEEEYAVADNPEELAGSLDDYVEAECYGETNDIWQDAIEPDVEIEDQKYTKTCAWAEWENQTLYLPMWKGITGGHTPSWLGEEPYNVPTMLEAFKDFCINDALWNCKDTYILYDEDGNPDDSGNFFETCITWTEDDPKECIEPVETGVAMSAETINLMMFEWNKDVAYAFWHPTWQYELGQWLKRLNFILETYDTNDVVDTFHIIGEGGRWTRYPEIGFRKLDELEVDLNKIWTEFSESGLPLEKLMVNAPGGRRGHRDSVELAVAEGIGVGVHGAGGLMGTNLLMLFPHVTYYDHLLMWRATEEMPFSRMHSDMEIFKTPNTLGEYRLLLPYILGSIAVGANRFLMTGSGIPSRGQAQINESLCVAEGSTVETGFGTMSDGTYQTNWDIYQSPSFDVEPPGDGGLDCWNDPANCERKCMFNWYAIKDWGAADNLEWMNKMTGRPFVGSPEAFMSFFTRGSANPNEDTLAQQHQDKILGKCVDALNPGYTDTWCQVKECTLKELPDISAEPDFCFVDSWNTGEENHLVSAEIIQVGHHMVFNPTLEGGVGTPDRQLNGELYGSVYINKWGNNLTNYVNGFTYPYEARSTWVPYSTGGDALYFDLTDEFVNTGINLEYGPPGAEDLASIELNTSAYAVKVTFAPSILPPPSLEDETLGGGGGIVIPEEGEYYDPDSDSGQFRLEYHGEDGWTEGPTVCFDATDTGLKTATFHLTDAQFGQGGANTFMDPDLLAGFEFESTEFADLAVRHVEGAHASIVRIRVIKLP